MSKKPRIIKKNLSFVTAKIKQIADKIIDANPDIRARIAKKGTEK